MNEITLESPRDMLALPASQADLNARSARRIRRVARLMDDAIKLPVINRKIGYDGIIGMVPGIGDAVTAVMSSYILVEAARAGVPKRVLVGMATRLGVDTLVGAIPVVGDLFDFAYKANRKNAETALKHIETKNFKLAD